MDNTNIDCEKFEDDAYVVLNAIIGVLKGDEIDSSLLEKANFESDEGLITFMSSFSDEVTSNPELRRKIDQKELLSRVGDLALGYLLMRDRAKALNEVIEDIIRIYPNACTMYATYSSIPVDPKSADRGLGKVFEERAKDGVWQYVRRKEQECRVRDDVGTQFWLDKIQYCNAKQLPPPRRQITSQKREPVLQISSQEEETLEGVPSLPHDVERHPQLSEELRLDPDGAARAERALERAARDTVADDPDLEIPDFLKQQRSGGENSERSDKPRPNFIAMILGRRAA